MFWEEVGIGVFRREAHRGQVVEGWDAECRILLLRWRQARGTGDERAARSMFQKHLLKVCRVGWDRKVAK